jgi:hypothetical protein
MANFFALFWGWADYKPKDWSGAAYKRARASSGEEVANFFALFWGWADYEPKNWSRDADKREYSARRSSVSYGWFG